MLGSSSKFNIQQSRCLPQSNRAPFENAVALAGVTVSPPLLNVIALADASAADQTEDGGATARVPEAGPNQMMKTTASASGAWAKVICAPNAL